MDLLLVTRGLMAVAVVVWHAEGYQGDFPSLLNVPGRTAVWIFFGISGYVIAYGFISSELDTELHVRSAFLQGLLLMNSTTRPEKFQRWKSLWTQYDDWLKQAGVTALQACLRYVLSFREISRVVVGVESQEQLQEILLAALGPSPDVPDALAVSNSELINPGRWAELS